MKTKIYIIQNISEPECPPVGAFHSLIEAEHELDRLYNASLAVEGDHKGAMYCITECDLCFGRMPL